MRLTAAGYYADYVLFPTVAAGLATAAFAAEPASEWPMTTLALVTGAATWTFTEYNLHRWVFHHVPYVREMHEAHHDDQQALIGSPSWVPLAILVFLVLLPLTLLIGFADAAAFSAGLAFGYTVYIIFHHGVHHWRLSPGSYLYRLKHRHALHHHFDDAGNFGVTTGFWDRIFGTDIKVGRERR